MSLSALLRHPLRRLAEISRRASDDGARTFDSWVARYDTIGRADEEPMGRFAASLARRPLFSILLPVSEVDRPDADVGASIASVFAQVYAHWELCIGASEAELASIGATSSSDTQHDGRVRYALVDDRPGAVAAKNAALDVATGDFVLVLEPGGRLSPHALLMLADAVDRQPEVELVYSDEDALNDEGERVDPSFKPDWNPALLVSQNYVGRLAAYRADRVRELGCFRSSVSGYEDWDLALRFTRDVDPRRIDHVPHILHHRKPQTPATVPDAADIAERVVQEHLEAIGAAGTVSRVGRGSVRVRYRLPEPAPDVHVIVPTTLTDADVEACVAGLVRETSYPRLRVSLVISEVARGDDVARAVVERASSDRRVDVLAYPTRPFNYSWVNNWAIAHSTSDIVCLLNDDVRVIEPDWLAVMVGHVVQPEVGAVGARLLYPNGTVQHGGVILGAGVADHFHRWLPAEAPGYGSRAMLDQDMSCVTAACMVIRRTAFDDVGGFDEELAIAYNDVDLCIRLRQQGWRIVYAAGAELVHVESASVGPPDSTDRREEFAREHQLMKARWGATLKNDPAYNPNLALRPLGRLAFPPRVSYPWRAGR